MALPRLEGELRRARLFVLGSAGLWFQHLSGTITPSRAFSAAEKALDVSRSGTNIPLDPFRIPKKGPPMLTAYPSGVAAPNGIFQANPVTMKVEQRHGKWVITAMSVRLNPEQASICGH